MVPEAPALTGDVRVAPAMGMQESSIGRKRVVFMCLKEEKILDDIHVSLGMRGCTWTLSAPTNA
jgi:hypothetical protein